MSERAQPLAPVPERPTLPRLRSPVDGCRACELWEGATQAVLGQGPARAELMLVGEQPGDREDVEGEPFVGPAGHVLDRALAQAGIDRDHVYLTNVVKHFRFKARGKRRSSILRAPDEPARREAHAAFVEDLAQVAAQLDRDPALQR